MATSVWREITGRCQSKWNLQGPIPKQIRVLGRTDGILNTRSGLVLNILWQTSVLQGQLCGCTILENSAGKPLTFQWKLSCPLAVGIKEVSLNLLQASFFCASSWCAKSIVSMTFKGLSLWGWGYNSVEGDLPSAQGPGFHSQQPVRPNYSSTMIMLC